MERITITIPPTLKRIVEAEAKRRGISTSEMMRRIVDRYYDEKIVSPSSCPQSDGVS